MIYNMIYLETKSVGHLYFLTLDSMFEYLNANPDDVINGYVGVEP